MTDRTFTNLPELKMTFIENWLQANNVFRRYFFNSSYFSKFFLAKFYFYFIEKLLLKLCLHELLQLSWAVDRHYFNRKFSIEVALLDCFTLVAKACQIKYYFLLKWKFSQIIWHSLYRLLNWQWMKKYIKLK